ncbi:MAG: hypothetical protein MUC88_23835 [Planctomycetes bacterium]|jgi:hypothetical protein|nr:hypothetical protein [Planctomycetota bacterium]
MDRELGPGYTCGLIMDFLNVGTCTGTTIDARITATMRPGTEFATGTTAKTARAFIPDYKATTPSQPSGDLGILYAGEGGSPAGITRTISFFAGAGSRRGTFREPYEIPDFRLLVCDVDGEPEQACEAGSTHETQGLPSSCQSRSTAWSRRWSIDVFSRLPVLRRHGR